MSDIHPDHPDSVPVFKCQVPPALLRQCSPVERHLVESADLARQQNDWLIHSSQRNRQLNQENHADIRRIEQRIQIIEDWRQVFMGKWGIAVWIAVLIVTASISAALKMGWEKLTGRPQ